MTPADGAVAPALDGLRVLNVSPRPPAAVAGMVLADFGADVLTIERPGGEPLRRQPAAPMWLRGTRSLVLDLGAADGRERLHALAADADVLVFSGRPSSARRLGVDRESLAALNARLISCAITGFGAHGPLAEYRGHEGIVAAKAGRMMTFAGQLSRPGPVYAYVPVGQHVAAQAALQGIVAALLVRRSTGSGQHVETSLLQGMMPYDLGGLLTLQLRRSRPEAFPTDPNEQFGRMPTLQYHPVLAADGTWIQLGNLVEHLFHSFIRVAGLDEIYADSRYQVPPNAYSEAAREELRDRILRRVRERPADDWMADFIADGNVAAERFGDTQSALSHPQLVHNGDVIEVQTRRFGRMQQIGPLAHMSRTPARPALTIPDPGEHQDANWRPRVEHVPPDTPPLRAPGEAPLRGITVLEFATIIATPYACSILGDLGARVIKVESIDGDPMRGMLSGVGATKTTASKESLCLDLKDPRGRAIARALMARADVLVHNFRPGVPERLGIGYEQARAVRPDIVYVSATGYGSDGPYAHRPNAHPVPGASLGGAYMQAGGAAALRVSDDVEELRETARQLMRANEVNPDPNTSLVIASAVLLALYVRATQGTGQHVQCNMMSANAYANSDDFVWYEGKPPRPAPDAGLRGLHALYRLYPARDDTWLFLACPEPADWTALTRALGDRGLAEDPRFRDADARRRHDADLVEALTGAFAGCPADEWERVLATAGVACVRADAATPAEFFLESDHARENGFVSPAEHTRWGPYLRHGGLTHFSESALRLGPGVLAGEHTRALLGELGYDARAIDALFAERVVSSEPA